MPPRVQKEYITVVKDDEHWHSLVNSESKKLSVVDVHLSWCGPCSLLAQTFRSIALKIDDWDNRIQFLTVDVDRVHYLKDVQNSSQPKFIFYLGSKIVAEVKGVNVPQIMAYINRYIPSLESD